MFTRFAEAVFFFNESPLFFNEESTTFAPKHKTSMTAILIDDDPDCNFVLATLLSQHCQGVLIRENCLSITAGQEAITRWNPDVVFLDVEIKEHTGFDLLQKMMPIHFEVVFVTGYEKYAMQAIKFSAVDFLTKPVDPEELVEAVEKVSQRLKEKKVLHHYEFLLDLVEGQKQKQKPSRMLLPHPQHGTEVVAFDQINFLKAEGAYTQFHLADNRVVLVSKHIGAYEQELADFAFLKVHRSYLINLGLVRFFKRSEDLLIMQNGAQVPVGKQGKDHLTKLF